MNPQQRQQLLAGLQQDGLLDADRQAQLQGEQPTAWWLQLLLALAAWVAALFILSSLMAPLLLIGNGPGVRVLFGVLLLIACGWLFRQPGAFVQQLALAFSLAGQALLVFPLVELSDQQRFDLRTLASVAAVLAAMLWWLPASSLHRLLCSLLVLGNLAVLIEAGNGLAVYALLLAGLTAFGWLSRADWCVWPQARFIKPTLHALGLVALGLMLFGHQALQERLWQFYSGGTVTHWLPVFYRLGSVVLLLAVVWRLSSTQSLQQRLLLLLVLAMVGWFTHAAPGFWISAALGLAAWQGGSRLWSWLALLAALAYLGEFYYSLHMTLLHKSLLLMGVGVLLLAVRGWMACGMRGWR